LNGIKVGTVMDFSAAALDLTALGRTTLEVIDYPVEPRHYSASLSFKRVEADWKALDEIFGAELRALQVLVEGLPGRDKECLAKIFIKPNFEKVLRRARRRRLKSICRPRKHG
jgi:hypothetical protein